MASPLKTKHSLRGYGTSMWNVFLLPLHVSLRHFSCKIGNSCYVTFAIEKNLTFIIFRSLVSVATLISFNLSSMHLTLSWQTVVPWSAVDKWIYLRTTSLSPKHSPGLAFSQPPKANTLNARKKSLKSSSRNGNTALVFNLERSH